MSWIEAPRGPEYWELPDPYADKLYPGMEGPWEYAPNFDLPHEPWYYTYEGNKAHIHPRSAPPHGTWNWPHEALVALANYEDVQGYPSQGGTFWEGWADIPYYWPEDAGSPGPDIPPPSGGFTGRSSAPGGGAGAGGQFGMSPMAEGAGFGPEQPGASGPTALLQALLGHSTQPQGGQGLSYRNLPDEPLAQTAALLELLLGR